MIPPIVFVHKALSRWEDVAAADADDLPALGEIGSRLREGRDIWIVTAYVVLKRLGCDVELRAGFVPGRICVAHHDDIHVTDLTYRCHVVGVRADRDRTFLCESEIVQSPAAVETRKQHYIPHWPQPGLVPRDRSRDCRVRRLGYFGARRNLAAAFRDAAFESELDRLGVELVVRDAPGEWHDYRDIDVVLAARDGTPYFLAGKPAAKLFNAWRAGCPALVGTEPAYLYHKQSEKDFIHVSCGDDVLRALKRLRQRDGLYAAMAANGRRRARKFTHEKLAERWIRLLYGPVMGSFIRWRRKPWLRRVPVDLVKYLARYARQELEGERYVRGSVKVGEVRGTPGAKPSG